MQPFRTIVFIGLITSLFGSHTPPNPIELVNGQQLLFANRPFIVDVLAVMEDRQARHYVLQIIGDGIIVSVDGLPGPTDPVIQGNTIVYGATNFEIQSNPNQYRINGTMISLPAPGKYAFSGGEFQGRRW